MNDERQGSITREQTMKENSIGYGVLLVDDDENFRGGIRNLLRPLEKEMSLSIHEALSGDAAMEMAGKGGIHCVLLDYRMPGGNGLEWLGKITARHDDIAVIMITGEGNEKIAVEAMKGGAVDYLVKGSITKENLYRTVKNALACVAMRRMIMAQQEELLQAERQRVMLESLGAACHHLGQPATVITGYLELIKKKETDSEIRAMIEQCIAAAAQMGDILTKLNQVSKYRAEPYMSTGKAEANGLTAKIIMV
jgi:FixJ family two-component response regulator